jgi:Fe-S cluster assembly ATPase SufC
VHVLVDGQIVRSGGADVGDQLERTGYSEWVDEPAIISAGEEVS